MFCFFRYTEDVHFNNESIFQNIGNNFFLFKYLNVNIAITNNILRPNTTYSYRFYNYTSYTPNKNIVNIYI